MANMNLPESFQRYGTAILAKNPEIAHQWSTASDGLRLSMPSSGPNGFDIECEIAAEAITLCWGNWHTRFEPTAGNDALVESLFGLIRDMLSPDMRLREFRAGSAPYRGHLQSFDGTCWSTEQEMSLIFWNYFGRRSVQTYSNAIRPGRMSKVK